MTDSGAEVFVLHCVSRCRFSNGPFILVTVVVGGYIADSKLNAMVMSGSNFVHGIVLVGGIFALNGSTVLA
jgi:hypothetical protein